MGAMIWAAADDAVAPTLSHSSMRGVDIARLSRGGGRYYAHQIDTDCRSSQTLTVEEGPSLIGDYRGNGL